MIVSVLGELLEGARERSVECSRESRRFLVRVIVDTWHDHNRPLYIGESIVGGGLLIWEAPQTVVINPVL